MLTAHDLFYRDGIRATGIDRIIAEACVTKVTFYRHFHSKNELVLAFLEFRHGRWMDWFSAALQRHGGDIAALIPALKEWFGSEGFRGCAFINSVAEFGPSCPEVLGIARRHKEEMTERILSLLPSGLPTDAKAVALAVDGAISRAQYGGSPDETLQSLERLLEGLKCSR